MIKNEKPIQCCIQVTVEHYEFMKKFQLSATKIFREAMYQVMHTSYDLPAKQSVYLSNSTNQPQAKNDSLITSSAPGTPPGSGPGTPPAALAAPGPAGKCIRLHPGTGRSRDLTIIEKKAIERAVINAFNKSELSA